MDECPSRLIASLVVAPSLAVIIVPWVCRRSWKWIVVMPTDRRAAVHSRCQTHRASW
jgi:hypothetical protein